MDAKKIKELSEHAQYWESSGEGQRKLREVLEEARRTKARLEECRRVDPEDLHKHFTL